MNVSWNDTHWLNSCWLRVHTHTHTDWVCVCVWLRWVSLWWASGVRRVIKASSLFKAAQTLLCAHTDCDLSRCSGISAVCSECSGSGVSLTPLSRDCRALWVGWAASTYKQHICTVHDMTDNFNNRLYKVREAASRCWIHNTCLMKATM